MATGKQLAFMCGEVSPAVRYNSKEVSYATGLDVLTNGYVRKEGGVVNRQGGKFLVNVNKDATNAYSSSSVNPLAPDIVVHTVWNPIKKEWTRFTFRNEYKFSSIPEASGIVLSVRVNGGPYQIIEPYEPGSLPDEVKLVTPIVGLNQIRMISVGDRVLMTPYVKYQRWFPHSGTLMLATYTAPNICYNFKLDEWEFFGLRDRPFGVVNTTGITRGLDDAGNVFMPARNLLTLVDENGYEYPLWLSPTTITDITSVDVKTPSSSTMPWVTNSTLMTSWKISLTANSVEARSLYDKCKIRLYRCSWVDGGISGMPLVFVGASGIVPGSGGPDSFEAQITDFSSVDVTLRPPAVSYALGFDGFIVGQLKTAVFFQQRLQGYADTLDPVIFAPVETEFPGSGGLKIEMSPDRIYNGEGQFLVSKFNVPHQLNQPVVYSRNTDAFSFNLTEARGKPPMHVIGAERVLYFMEDGVFCIQGDQSGAITPTLINSVKISSIGSHETVAPVMAKNKVYYVDSTGRRLLVTEWSGDAEGYTAPTEVTMFSAHLLDGDEALKLVTVSGREESLFILTKKGKLLQVTVHEGGITGWAVHTMADGVQQIDLVKVKPSFEENFDEWLSTANYKDALMVFTSIQTYLDIREDSEARILDQVFMDSATFVGTANVRYGNTHWRATLPLSVKRDYTEAIPGGFIFDTSEVPRFVHSRTVGDPREVNIINYSAYPTYFLSMGDLSTTDWTPGATIPIYTTTEIVTAGNHAGIDYNDMENFRIEVPFTEQVTLENRAKKQVSRRVRLKVDLSTKTVETGYMIGFKYLAEIEDTEVPEKLRCLYEKYVGNPLAPYQPFAEVEQLITNWKITYKDFIQELVHGPTSTELSNLALSMKTQEGIPPTDAFFSVEVSAMSDTGVILGSPLNSEYPEKAIIHIEEYAPGLSRARLSLGDFYSGVWVGRPYEFNMTTLPIEASDNRTLLTGKTIVNEVGVALNNTRGGFVGLPDTPLEDMQPMSNLRNYNPYAFAQTPTSYSGFIQYSVPSEWADGRVTFKNVDPTPINVLAIFPRGESSAR